MKTLKIIFLTFLSFHPGYIFSQAEFNNWYFGGIGPPIGAGLTFNSGSPVAIPNGVMWSAGATISVSDSSGNLLYFSDGINVYNRNKVVMPNGSGLLGNNGDIKQFVISTPIPGDDSSYYIFTVGIYAPLVSSPLYYSIINMRLDGGLGDIEPGFKNIPIPGTANTWWSITGTRHKNNKDVWIITTISSTTQLRYAAFLINNSGIVTTPVLSYSEGFGQLPFVSDWSPPISIRVSRDGTKLAASSFGYTEFCTFNSQTGTVNRLFYIPTDNYNSNISAEFSIDSKYLYVSKSTGGNGAIYQYNATLLDSAAFVQSRVLIDTGYIRNVLQMGPDWKIYGTEFNVDSLSVIHNPSNYGQSCHYQRNAIGLTGPSSDGLPQFIQKYKAYIHQTGFCQNDSVNFTGDIYPPPDSLHWGFGDPASGTGNFSNLPNPTHIYNNTGTFIVELFVRHIDNRTDTSWQTITILPSPQPNLGLDKTICQGDSILLDAGACTGCTFVWDNLTTGLMNIANTQTYYAKTSGNFRVTVTNSNGCMGRDTILITLTPLPQVINNPLAKSICSGESTNIPLIANVPVTTFHWTVTLTSGNITGYSPDSGLIINQILINALATPGVVTYHITPKVGSCTGSIVDFLVTVNPGDSVKVSISASTNNICAGTPVTFTAIPTNGGASPSYLWKVNGTSIGPDNPVFSYSPNNGDVVLCILTSSIGVCTSNNPATSNSITMVVNLLLPVSVNVTPSLNPSCAGNPVTFIATPTNGGTTPTYLWKVNGNSVGTNSPVYTYIPASGDLITCIMTSIETCTSNNPDTSNTVTMTVNPNLPVSVSISASANPFCHGATVNFTAAPTNGGGTPFYQWEVNGADVGPNSPVYAYSPNNGDVISCIMNSSIACPTGNPATSNSISMLENNNSPVSIVINATANSVCNGTSVTFTAVPTNGGTIPVYQWKVNGIIVGTNNSVYTYSPSNSDIIQCILTSNLFCASGNPANSNTITMTVNSNLAVSIAINSSANQVCAGTQVTFSANPTNPGTLPVYQWKVNGINAGANNLTYSYIPNSGDQISCILTSNAICPTGNPATSNIIAMTVNPNLPVSVSITASNNPVCAGIPVTFTATPTNGGNTPVYQWKVNGNIVGTNITIYQYTPTNGDVINCTLTSNVSCPVGNPATSNTITMNISALPIVTYTLCNDSITAINAQPFKLRGGIPLNGTYSGPGVNSITGTFTPSSAGIGIKTLTYSYTNAALCSASATHQITVVAAPGFNCGNNLTDVRDSKVYPTVQIGSQCWMAGNLNYGTLISGNTIQRDNCIPEKYCFNDLNVNCGIKTYYQWDELMQYDEVVSRQGLCPPGWHVPTEADWNILFSNFISNAFAASPLKYSGFSGFDALLSGAEHQNKNWDYQGFATFFWSSTAHSRIKALAHGMNDIDPSVSLYPSLRSNAFSVRCLKD